MTLFKGNMKRLFLQRNGLILLAYILVISAIQFYTYNRPNYYTEPSVFPRLLCFDSTGYGTEVYAMTLPIMVAFFGAGLYREDVNRAMILNQEVRFGRKAYYYQQYFTAFIGGGLAGISPFIVSSTIFFMVYPMTLPDPIVTQLNTISPGILYSLYSLHPFVLWLLFGLGIFLISGILTCLSLTASYFIAYKYFEYFFSFVVIYLTPFVFGIIGIIHLGLIPMMLLSHLSSLNEIEWIQTITFWLVLELISGILFLWKLSNRNSGVD